MVTRQEAFRRHATYYTGFLEQKELSLRGPDQAALLEQIEEEYPHICKVMEGSLEADPGVILLLTGYLRSFWEIRGYLSEGREWLQRAIAVANSSCNPKALLKVLIANGNLAQMQGDYAAAWALFQRSLEFATEPRNISVLLNNLGLIAWRQGKYASARDFYERSLDIDYQAGDAADIATVLNNLGVLASDQQDYSEARVRLEESLSFAKRAGNSASIATALNGLGVCAQMQNQLEEALGYHLRSLKIKQDMRNPHGEANSLHNMGLIMLVQGDLTNARTQLVNALKIRVSLDDNQGLIEALEGSAQLILEEGYPARAVTLLGRAEKLRIEIGAVIPPDEDECNKECASKALKKLTPEAYEHAWQEGQLMNVNKAVEYVLQGGEQEQQN